MVEPPDDTDRVLMEWSLRDDPQKGPTDRRVRAIPHDGTEGAWKTVLETRLHTDLWVENATIGYADSLDEIGTVDLPC